MRPLKWRPWKEKYLDYEIETVLGARLARVRRFRLKRKVSRLRDWNLPSWQPQYRRRPAWKEKYLDYEIETKSFDAVNALNISVSWKEKYLDYEIETFISNQFCKSSHRILKRKVSRLRDWNIDALDPPIGHFLSLKRKVSRLRDWNINIYHFNIDSGNLEKKSISITRLKRFENRFVSLASPSWKEKYLDCEIETLS